MAETTSKPVSAGNASMSLSAPEVNTMVPAPLVEAPPLPLLVAVPVELAAALPVDAAVPEFAAPPRVVEAVAPEPPLAVLVAPPRSKALFDVPPKPEVTPPDGAPQAQGP